MGEKYNVIFDYENYVYDGQADMNLMKKIGKQLVDAKVDLVISIATPPTVAMKNILAEAGLTMANVVKITVFLADMADFAEMNEVYASFFEGVCPARSAVAVKTLPKEARVEIECIAVR